MRSWVENEVDAVVNIERMARRGGAQEFFKDKGEMGVVEVIEQVQFDDVEVFVLVPFPHHQ